MARKRMIDPQIWESAYDKQWGTEELTLMISAISTADDEGKGRISLLRRNVSLMFSERKFKKTLEKLSDSIQIYDKIYFFLPNFLKYQTINRPKPSSIPDPKLKENKELPKNNHGVNHGTEHKNGETSEVKLSEVNLKRSEVKLSENEITSSIFFEKTKKLFEENTKISDPNIFTHIGPIVELWESSKYENMDQKDIDICFTEIFKTLDKNKGINLTYLLENIHRKIIAKHEAVLERGKQKLLNEAKNERINAENEEIERVRQENNVKISQYKKFFNDNPKLFSMKEKYDLAQFFKNNQVLNAGKIIESKMEEVEL